MYNYLVSKLRHHADVSPLATALVSEERTCSYYTLDMSSDYLACEIDSLESEEAGSKNVGIYMDKSIEAVVSMYACMKSSYTYLNLDVSNPAERVYQILMQCEVSVLITTPDSLPKLLEIVKEDLAGITVVVACNKSLLSCRDLQNYMFKTHTVNLYDHAKCNKYGNSYERECLNDVAAIFYTSGSSGTPKGVMVTHQNIELFVRWGISYFNVTSTDCLSSHAPLHFDLSIFDIFVSVTAGASVVLVHDAIKGNPKALLKMISEWQITIWQSVPSVLVLIKKYGDIGSELFPKLRHLIFAGERLNVEVIEFLSKNFIAASFHNVYGATETNDSFIFSFSGRCGEFPESLPIGKPLPYVKYLVVDKDANSCSSVDEGELLVSSPTTMKGYNDGDRSKFILIDSICGENVKEEFYRTGDIVRQLVDGNLMYIGRTDNIVKSNGFRVNTLEIELSLMKHQAISNAAVLSVPDSDYGTRLIGVYTTSEKVSEIDLRKYCSEQLPRYAIPHRFKYSDEPLPMTSSGKVDKRKLANNWRKTNV